MEDKQTAVQWLFKQLWEEPKDKMVWYALLTEAMAMERAKAMGTSPTPSPPPPRNTSLHHTPMATPPMLPTASNFAVKVAS